MNLKPIFKVSTISLVIAGTFLIAGITYYSLAQPRDEPAGPYQAQIERARQERASVQLENRLTKLETKMDGIEKLLWTVTGALIAVMVGNLYGFISRKKVAY